MSWMDRELFEKMIEEFETDDALVRDDPAKLVALLKHLHQRLDQVESKVAFGGL
jgi:hypothetical protein